MLAQKIPPYVEFVYDATGRNVKYVCGERYMSADLKHGDSSGSFRVWFRSKDSEAISEDLRTHRRCEGTLFAPAGGEIVSLGAPNPSSSASASPQATPLGQPPLIGSVHIEAARYYRITLVDRETFEGHPVFRLALQAYRDPNNHPLTGMLVDADTFLVRRVDVTVAGHFVVASGGANGDAVFDRIGPYWIIRDEDFTFAGNLLFVHARGTVAMRGSNFSYPAELPSFFPSPSPSPSAPLRNR